MPLPSRQSYKQSRSAILAAPGRSMGTGTTGQKQLWRSRFRDCAPEADYAVLKAPSCVELLALTIRRSQRTIAAPMSALPPKACRDVRFVPIPDIRWRALLSGRPLENCAVVIGRNLN